MMTRAASANNAFDLFPTPAAVARAAIGWLCFLGVATSAMAQLPATRLYALSSPGAQQGTEFDVKITSGADLDDVDRLHFSHPGITATAKMAEPTEFQTAAQTVPGEFHVAVAGDVPPGVYEVRAVGKYGISNPRAFVVGECPEVFEQEGNDTLADAQEIALETLVNGTADSEGADCFRVTLQAGQRLLADCWADRIDSRMDPTLVLYSPDGVELCRSRDSCRLDPLLDFQAPADGAYVIKLYDFTYRGGADYFYRLAIGTGPHIDYIMPPAGADDGTGEFVLYGRNLPGGTPVEGVEIEGAPIEQLAVQIALPDEAEPHERLSSGGLVAPEDAMLDGFDYRYQSTHGVSNPVFIGFATAPVVLEAEPNDEPAAAQMVTAPCEVAGQFYPAGDRDLIRFEAAQGEVYWIEVFSQRLGLPSDPYVLIQRVTTNDQGEESISDIQQLDDHNKNIGGNDFATPTHDPVYRMAVPEDGTYQISVRDLYGDSRSDPRLVYRLSIRREQPDFRLVAAPIFPTKDNNQTQPWTPLLRRGGSETIRVMAFRLDNFSGPVDITAASLPEGVHCAPITIGPGMDSAHLVLTAKEDAPAWAGEIKIVGRARIGDADVERAARGGGVIWPGQRNQVPPIRSRMTRNLAIAVTDGEVAPFALAADADLWETSRAGKLQIPIKAVRRGEFKGNLALTATDVPGEFKAKNVTINGDKSEGTFEIDITPKATPGVYSLAIQAETQVSYARNPEAAAAAEKEKQRIEALAAELATASQQAETAKQQTEKAAVEAAALAETEQKTLAAALAESAQAEALLAAATEKVAQAKQALSEKPDDEGLAEALAEAEKALAAADTKRAETKTALIAAQSTAETMQASADAAAKARDAAKTAAAEAAAKAKRADAAREAAAKQAKALADAAKAKNIAVFSPMTNITVKVAEAPVQVSAGAPADPLQPSSQIEIPVNFERQYGFADVVKIEPVLPKGISGLTAAAVDVPADQTGASVVIQAGDKPSIGSFSLTLRVKLKFNGQDLQVEQSIPFAVAAAP